MVPYHKDEEDQINSVIHADFQVSTSVSPTIQVNLDMTDHCTTDFYIWRMICLVPVWCISSICHMYTTDFAYDGPISLVPLSPSYPSSPVVLVALSVGLSLIRDIHQFDNGWNHYRYTTTIWFKESNSKWMKTSNLLMRNSHGVWGDFVIYWTYHICSIDQKITPHTRALYIGLHTGTRVPIGTKIHFEMYRYFTVSLRTVLAEKVPDSVKNPRYFE